MTSKRNADRFPESSQPRSQGLLRLQGGVDPGNGFGKFHGDMTFFVSAFAVPMKINSRFVCFCSMSQFSVLHLFTFCFHVYFSRQCECLSNIEILGMKKVN